MFQGSVFSGIYPTAQSIYKGNRTTNLDYTFICYDGNFSSCNVAILNLSTYINRRDVYHYPGNGSVSSVNDYFYDQYGNLTYEGDNDYNGARLKTTAIILNSQLCSSKDICNHPASVLIPMAVPIKRHSQTTRMMPTAMPPKSASGFPAVLI